MNYPLLFMPITQAIMVKNFHIFGKGISFSVSPTIHSAGFQHYVLPFTYTIHESNSIDEAVVLIKRFLLVD